MSLATVIVSTFLDFVIGLMFRNRRKKHAPEEDAALIEQAHKQAR